MYKSLAVVLGFIFVSLYSVTAQSEPNIVGYGSSDAVLSGKNQELFYMGFNVGMMTSLGDKYDKNLVLVKHVFNGSYLGAIEASKYLIESGVKVLTGFPTSHEALLAAKIAKENDVLAIFPAATHQKLAEFGNKIYTTGNPESYYIKRAFGFISDKFPKANVYVIINPTAVYSNSQISHIESINKARNTNQSKIIIEYLDENLKLPKTEIEKIKNDSSGIFYFTQYVDESVSLLQQLDENMIDRIIVASSAWACSDTKLVTRYLEKKKSKLFSMAPWSKNEKIRANISMAVKKIYEVDPTPEMNLGYDVGVIIGEVYKRINGPITKESFFEAFRKNLCFEKTTKGKICFNKDGGHAMGVADFIEITKTGKIVYLDYE